MKKDNLEQFISENRSAFDLEQPSLKSWYQIEKQLDQKAKKQRLSKVWKASRVAAAVMLLLVTGGVIGSLLTQQANRSLSLESLEKIAPELLETELYYQEQLNEKIKLLTAYKEESPKILKDLESNNQLVEELKLELLEAPKGTEEIVINNIIRTYQLKLEILENVLENLEQSKIQNSDSNGTINI